ncbi:MAG: hypothetical protein ACKO2V_11060, partial [Snowella sp.]
AALIFSPAISGKPSLGSIINCILGGLVGITASSGYVDLKLAIFIGGIAGVVVLSGEKLLILWKIDDPVSAIPVHLFCGFWGTIAVCLSGTKNTGEFANGMSQENPFSQVFFQFMGWVVVMAFTFIFSLILWLFLGNILYYYQKFTLGQKNKQTQPSSVRNNPSINLMNGFSQFWRIGREGIRVSLSEELNGSDGTIIDS